LTGFLDLLGELVRLGRVELTQPYQYATRIVEPSHLRVRLAQILERLRKVGAEPERFVIRVEGFLVAALVAEGIAELVPRLREGGSHGDRGLKRHDGCRPVLDDTSLDAAVVFVLGVGGAW